MKLTRQLVLAKAKASDLESVKKLNCWGCNLTDMSHISENTKLKLALLWSYFVDLTHDTELLRLWGIRRDTEPKSSQSWWSNISIFSQIPNIKVLTLSANSISSLAPLAHCVSLCELYLWRNMITSLSELSHLQPLAHLKVLWLAENPCCGSEYNKYRMTVLRTLPHLHRLDNQVVTEEEVNLAMIEGDVVTTPPGTNPTLLPTNGLSESESGNDPLNYNMEETNKIREELGMKPLSRDKFPSLSSSSTKESKSALKKTHTLDAVLLLLRDMDKEELDIVLAAAQNRLQTFTQHPETMNDSLQTHKTVDAQH